MADPILLFVYGTLKRGLSRHHVLKDQEFICAAFTVNRFRLFDCGGYPGLIRSDNGQHIQGEIFDITSRCLEQCDIVEAVKDGLYSRETIDVRCTETADIHAGVWVYLYQHSTNGLRDCGTIWTE